MQLEPEIETTQRIYKAHLHLGYQLFPASFCVVTPSRRGFVLVWHLCIVSILEITDRCFYFLFFFAPIFQISTFKTQGCVNRL